MIDSKTGEKIVVLIDIDEGPYIRISNWNDADELEDLFADKYDILFEMKSPADLEEHNGKEYYFGSVADPVKLQKILDEIDLES